ncbi:MAG: TonB family protein [Cyclobacteriaceae bacterium]|nr:TonB family protein [Cyclobacteriaceae bacterium]
MKKKGRHSTSGFDEEALKRYLNDEMTSQERHAFEKTMLQSDFEADALEGLSTLPSDQWQQDIAGLRNSVLHARQKKIHQRYWQVAAAIAFIISVGSLWLILFNMNADLPGEIARQEVGQNDEPIPPDTLEVNTETTEVELRQQPVPEIVAEASKSLSQRSEKRIPDPPAPVQAPSAVQEIMDEVAAIPREEEVQWQEIASAPNITDSMHKKVSRIMPTVVRGEALPAMQFQGQVFDASDGYPLPGVNVVIKGRQEGVVTNEEGRFQLPFALVPEDSLILSSVGYMNKTIAVFQSSEVKMEPDINALSEVVVIGYGVAQAQQEAQQEAQPVGGYAAFRRFVKENMQFPEAATSSSGVVRLSFKVAETGRIEEIKILKSPDKLFEDEAIRLLETGPVWEPARKHGMAVKQEVRLSIRFKRP